jgi:TRAP-type C4-dicarboxylate transport system permease small subunit
VEKPTGWGHILERAVEFVGGIVLALATLVTILQVLFRYVLKVPFIWSEEFTRFLFIWIVWFGAALATPRGKHMVIEFIRDRFPEPWPMRVKVATDLLALFFLGVVVVKGVSLVGMTAREFYVTFPLSVKYAYLASVVGGALMFFFLAHELRSTFRRFPQRGKRK